MIGGQFYFGVALIVTAAISTAQTETRNTPIRYTSPFGGEQMYVSYCAVCHGDKGKGDGPAVAAMKAPLRDLTTLSQSNGGHFPRARVFFFILNGGSRPGRERGGEMPAWQGPFNSLCIGQQGCGAQVQMRVVRLTDYLESLQLK